MAGEIALNEVAPKTDITVVDAAGGTAQLADRTTRLHARDLDTGAYTQPLTVNAVQPPEVHVPAIAPLEVLAAAVLGERLHDA